MKSLFFSVTLLGCFLHSGRSFQCYTCKGASSDAYCLQVANCTGSTPYCGTSIVSFNFVTILDKYCAAACVTGNQSVAFFSSTESCCASDLCNNQKIGNVNYFDFNSAGATSSSLMVAIAGLLWALLALAA
ncbi:hypothetical protein XENTR_v10017359 [Xenopus tropicalis]|uniref:Prostate stem cell antigen-like n=1 Tax=Xenopus tropicalis TaxID=8364 RepID=A0A8J1JTI6_XENTR|nr:prostate stem cell antigen-like [Xenopus tropicalis]KAE8599852.1 hypothetical protein XENTR_v10017359 [Xenopus tropicalis]